MRLHHPLRTVYGDTLEQRTHWIAISNHTGDIASAMQNACDEVACSIALLRTTKELTPLMKKAPPHLEVARRTELSTSTKRPSRIAAAPPAHADELARTHADIVTEDCLAEMSPPSHADHPFKRVMDLRFNTYPE